jgi:hypothetical protein
MRNPHDNRKFNDLRPVPVLPALPQGRRDG